ncbi:endo-1,4-beta-xylanase [Paenibacillus rhizoplanae]
MYANDFAIGAAAYSWQMEGVYGELLKKHFNSITATYEMKPKFLAPSEGTYVFDGADKYVNFCPGERNGTSRTRAAVAHRCCGVDVHGS